MSEFLSNKPERERTEAEAKEFEAKCIANIVGYLRKADRGEIAGEQAADWAMDDVIALCRSLAERDRELGLFLLMAIETHDIASSEPDPAEPIREALGLPVPDYMAQLRPDQVDETEPREAQPPNAADHYQ